MKNKSLISLVIIVLISALTIMVLITKYSYSKVSESNIASIDEVISEIQDTNEELQNTIENIVEDTINTQENIALESSEEIEPTEIIKSDVKGTAEINNNEIQETKQSKPETTSQKDEIKTEAPQKTNENNKAIEENKPIETIEKQTQEKNNTSNNITKCEHSSDWYNTEADAVAVYKAKLKYWEDKWSKYEIDNDEFYANRPNGYETWDCPYCHKWTINIY